MTEQTPCMIWESREIDRWQSLESLVNELQQALEEGWSSWDLVIYEGDDSWVEFTIKRERPETPEEIERRVAFETYSKEFRKRQYLELKKEFEGQD